MAKYKVTFSGQQQVIDWAGDKPPTDDEAKDLILHRLQGDYEQSQRAEQQRVRFDPAALRQKFLSATEPLGRAESEVVGAFKAIPSAASEFARGVSALGRPSPELLAHPPASTWEKFKAVGQEQAGAAADILGGAYGMAAPIAVPIGMVADPLGTLGAVGGFTAAEKLAQLGEKALGISPKSNVGRLIPLTVGTLGGGLGAHAGERLGARAERISVPQKSETAPASIPAAQPVAVKAPMPGINIIGEKPVVATAATPRRVRPSPPAGMEEVRTPSGMFGGYRRLVTPAVPPELPARPGSEVIPPKPAAEVTPTPEVQPSPSAVTQPLAKPVGPPAPIDMKAVLRQAARKEVAPKAEVEPEGAQPKVAPPPSEVRSATEQLLPKTEEPKVESELQREQLRIKVGPVTLNFPDESSVRAYDAWHEEVFAPYIRSPEEHRLYQSYNSQVQELIKSSPRVKNYSLNLPSIREALKVEEPKVETPLKPTEETLAQKALAGAKRITTKAEEPKLEPKTGPELPYKVGDTVTTNRGSHRVTDAYADKIVTEFTDTAGKVRRRMEFTPKEFARLEAKSAGVKVEVPEEPASEAKPTPVSKVVAPPGAVTPLLTDRIKRLEREQTEARDAGNMRKFDDIDRELKMLRGDLSKLPAVGKPVGGKEYAPRGKAGPVKAPLAGAKERGSFYAHPIEDIEEAKRRTFASRLLKVGRRAEEEHALAIVGRPKELIEKGKAAAIAAAKGEPFGSERGSFPVNRPERDRMALFTKSGYWVDHTGKVIPLKPEYAHGSFFGEGGISIDEALEQGWVRGRLNFIEVPPNIPLKSLGSRLDIAVNKAAESARAQGLDRIDVSRGGQSIPVELSELGDFLSNPDRYFKTISGERGSFSFKTRKAQEPGYKDITPFAAEMRRMHLALMDSEIPGAKEVGKFIPSEEDREQNFVGLYERKLAGTLKGLNNKERLQVGELLNRYFHPKQDVKVDDTSLIASPGKSFSPAAIEAADKARDILIDIHGWYPKKATRLDKSVGFLTNYWPHMAQELGDHPDFSDYMQNLIDYSLVPTRELGGVFKGKRVVPPEEAPKPGTKAPIYGKGLGKPFFGNVEPRTGALKDIEYDPRRVFPAYTEGAARIIFAKPAVERAKEMIAKIPDSNARELAQELTRSYARYQATPGLDNAWRKLSSRVMRINARSDLYFSGRLFGLHAAKLLNAIYPEVGEKYLAQGIMDLLKNPVHAYQEAGRIGLKPMMIRPWMFKRALEKMDAVGFIFNISDFAPTYAGWKGLTRKYVAEGMPEAKAVKEALFVIKDLDQNVSPARISHLYARELGPARPVLQYKQQPIAILEQYLTRPMQMWKEGNKAGVARYALGVGASIAAYKALGIATWHIGSSLFKVGAPAYDKMYQVASKIGKGNFAGAASDLLKVIPFVRAVGYGYGKGGASPLIESKAAPKGRKTISSVLPPTKARQVSSVLAR